MINKYYKTIRALISEIKKGIIIKLELKYANIFQKKNKQICTQNLFWFMRSDYRSTNFGDVMGAYLFEKIMQSKPIFKTPDNACKETVLMTIGSILQYARTNSIIWGSGIISSREQFPQPYLVCAVRGKHTFMRFKKLGYKCPEIYGDPSLLLPRYYSPKVEKKYSLGIIPHYWDYDEIVYRYKNSDALIINVLEPIETVVSNILSCQKTISSSLHGVIVSHAYGIPSLNVDFSNKLEGDGVKFMDYYSALDITMNWKYDLSGKTLEIKELSSLVESANQPQVSSILLDQLLKSFPYYDQIIK